MLNSFDAAYRSILRPILFRLDAEASHDRVVRLLGAVQALPGWRYLRTWTHPALSVRVSGLDFMNPVGLAAGCDKNARAPIAWIRLGFGFAELGTVTNEPQPGNPRPRIARLPKSRAIVNSIGFNSDGAEIATERLSMKVLARGSLGGIYGFNIGKSRRVTGTDETMSDFLDCYRSVFPTADFVVINVSSPNTPGLRDWEQPDRLRDLLGMLLSEQELYPDRPPHPALFVKISPDMTDAEMAGVVEVALDLGIAGIVATNTTTRRDGVPGAASIPGGLSGRPLRDRAMEVLRFLYRESQGRLTLIGVGGIGSAEDAYARILAGASLVELYTALVYEGPFLARRINEGLLRLMERDGVRNIGQVVGVE